MIPNTRPLAQYWQVWRRWPSSSGVVTREEGCPSAVTNSSSLVPILFFARSSTVGTLGSATGGAVAMGVNVLAGDRAAAVSSWGAGLCGARLRGCVEACGAGDCTETGASSTAEIAEGLDLAGFGSCARLVRVFGCFLGSGLAALAASLSVSPKILVIELLRPLPAPAPMAAPADAAACSVRAWP